MKSIFEKLDRYFCDQWQLAVLDMDFGRWIVSACNKNIPYLKAENANGRHILMQPTLSNFAYYMMIDDLCLATINLHHKFNDGTWKPGRLVVETSPDNYQVWIHSKRPLSLNEKRYWLKRLCNDPSADPDNRWGRCPGFRNRKKKHMDSNSRYPLAKLIWIDWKFIAQIPQINPWHFAKAGKPEPFSHQPRGECAFNKNISRSNYEKGNESQTDFSYALALARLNFPLEKILKRLKTERSNWENHKSTKKKSVYLNRTIKKAIAIVQNS